MSGDGRWSDHRHSRPRLGTANAQAAPSRRRGAFGTVVKRHPATTVQERACPTTTTTSAGSPATCPGCSAVGECWGCSRAAPR
ncbi:hypothetical protein ACFPM0_15165 [Pseudonocardia sulfidoxydans]|uniref:hypothetical protein n=1 Tax=Pseudonocardia sulfidoxydans TaxID=54011 RepID=UPI00361AE051